MAPSKVAPDTRSADHRRYEMSKMDLTLVGVAFTDYLLTSVGANTFRLKHDYFTKQNLVVRTAAGGGGTLLAEDTDFILAGEDIYLSTQVTTVVGSGRNVVLTVQIINAAYQACDLYFSGKYIADAVEAVDVALPLYVVTPWMKNLAALAAGETISGACNTDLSMALKDTTKDFTAVVAGDIVRNTTSRAFATVLYKISTTTLMLDADIFPAGNEAYKVYAQPVVAEQNNMEGCVELTGALLDGDGIKVANNDTLNHLKDSVTAIHWTGIIAVGDWAMNLATGKAAQVTVVADHDLTLQWDAFPSGNEKYMIFAGYVTIVDADSLLNGEVLPEMNIGGRFVGGGLTAGYAEDDSAQRHYHTLMGGAGAISDNFGGSVADYGVGIGVEIASYVVGNPVTDTVNGIPRVGDHTQPRVLRMTMILRIK